MLDVHNQQCHLTNGSRFEIKLGGLSWVSNFEKTRWFLVLQLQRPEEDELNKLLMVCNRVVEDYSQPPLYAQPISASQHSSMIKPRPKRLEKDGRIPLSRNGDTVDFSSAFHISIGWALEQPSSSMMNLAKSTFNDTIFDSLKAISVKVAMIKVKVGNVVTNISLVPKGLEGKGLFGI
jgi:U6 snRNA phosphodiesterase